MKLEDIYKPIRKEMARIERKMAASIENSGNKSVLTMGGYVLRSGGKRLRPALVALSARVAMEPKRSEMSGRVINVGSAVELIHIASLIHDDVIDHSDIRHNKPTINAKWGPDMSLILGDYFYSIGFDLISSCDNLDILNCISQATRMMCEGELVQVCQRDNLKLMREHYITIVKNKTANLFAASCQAGALAAGTDGGAGQALKRYGLNLGIAFQIIDDSMDIVGEEEELGKAPGADFKMGELTLPLLNLISENEDKDLVESLIARKESKRAFGTIRRMFINSGALAKTKDDARRYSERAKDALRGMSDSAFKESLYHLADHMVERIKL